MFLFIITSIEIVTKLASKPLYVHFIIKMQKALSRCTRIRANKNKGSANGISKTYINSKLTNIKVRNRCSRVNESLVIKPIRLVE